MMYAAYDQERCAIAWAAAKIGIPSFGPHAHAIAQMRGAEMVGVVVYDDFTPWNCTMHVASDGSRKWLTRDFLFRVFAYPFIQLDLGRVTLFIKESNASSLRFARHLGFAIECPRVVRLFGSEGGVMLRMLREECRWIARPFAVCAGLARRDAA